ncbi:heavy metal-associated domain-containing protein [uncultured Flavobacterium sp.]|uniref:heavy-metal-associated domain-containing protein n=1 Tax=uncultured Flavobacterium sp. TaxID=165435 RepID=UPI0030C83056
MNIIKQSLFIASISLLLVSCKDENSSSSEEIQAIEQDTTNTVVVNPQMASFEIEGMTCEIGCASLIESKLNKLDGVTEAKVDFESKTATVTYDADKLNQEKLTKTVEGVAGGELYKVSKVKS